MQEFIVEHAVVHEQIAGGEQSLPGQPGGPGLEHGIHVPADFFEQFGIAEGRIAVADEHQIAIMIEKQRSKFEVGPKPLERGRGGDDFQIAGRHEREGGIGVINRRHVVGGFAHPHDVDSDGRPGQEFVVQYLPDVPRQIRPRRRNGRKQGEKKGENRQGDPVHP